jgi:hypothetical protein
MKLCGIGMSTCNEIDKTFVKGFSKLIIIDSFAFRNKSIQNDGNLSKIRFARMMLWSYGRRTCEMA